ncbi:PP2C family serine/threonine-protein phosphatase [Phormidium sp. FACHB-1136]|uniref:PP2C family serine/threonine-protein phosphatase n=1 Tax=Phormidium sp. FACHB-1136 TaxID=2692848 RepID=UPI00168300E0|nr:PP2C family serine/threonine-protein phosphatase [Phormidium sp. FACHB-1136]MBD2429323.1 protein phosphatase 2C domain-containing protein [Phormidium sp. FACHB-1136]
MWQAIGASTLGTSHLKTGTPCQDAHGYRVLPQAVVAAVADGLGSAAQSHVGSALALETALTVLEQALPDSAAYPIDAAGWKLLLAKSFAAARQALVDQAEAHAHPLSDLATTLIVVIWTAEWLTVGQLGDGAVVMYTLDDMMATVIPPQRGEFVNETFPLTQANALDLVEFCTLQEPLRAVCLLTDGLQTLSMNVATGQPYRPFFMPFFEALAEPVDTQTVSEELRQFLASPRVCSKTDDDKTIVVLSTLHYPHP